MDDWLSIFEVEFTKLLIVFLLGIPIGFFVLEIRNTSPVFRLPNWGNLLVILALGHASWKWWFRSES